MFNKVIMLGNLTRDPELRYTAQGTPVTTLRLAVNTKHRTSGEGQKEETLFIDAVVWGKYAETCAERLSKGSQVLVEGRLQEDSWQADGQRKTKMQIVARDVRFINTNNKAGDTAVEPF
jgi:single-strand DNA-binding protein